MVLLKGRAAGAGATATGPRDPTDRKEPMQGTSRDEFTSPWAAGIYNRAPAFGKDHPHATRILARAWIHVMWRCWQNRTPYDPTPHGGAQHPITQPTAT